MISIFHKEATVVEFHSSALKATFCFIIAELVLLLVVLAKLIWSLIVLAWPLVVFVVLVCSLVVFVFPLVVLVCSFACPFVVLVCPLVVLVVPSVGLFINDRKLRTFWDWEVQTQKIKIAMIFILTNKRMTWYIHTTLIILYTKSCVQRLERIVQLLHNM